MPLAIRNVSECERLSFRSVSFMNTHSATFAQKICLFLSLTIT